MKVLHVIPSIHPRYGGPSKAVIDMCKYQIKNKIKADIATTHFKDEKIKGANIFSFPSYMNEYKYSPELKKWLKENIKNYDVVHIHSVFCFSTKTAARIAKKNNVPYIVRTIGQFYEWSLNNKSSLAKKFYLKMFENKTLKDASLVHFTTEHERKHFSPNINNKCFILPLGIEDNDLTKDMRIPQGKNLLFLSRIHKKKGLDFLIPLMKNINNSEWNFLIAGDGKKRYVDSLKKLTKEKGIENKVFFLGDIRDGKKNYLFQNSDAFILPSYSENFGVVVAEAISKKLPVLISNNVGVKNFIEKYDAGIVFDLKNTKEVIDELFSGKLNINEKRKNAKLCADECFNWNKITKKQKRIYKWLLSQ